MCNSGKSYSEFNVRFKKELTLTNYMQLNSPYETEEHFFI